MKPSKSEQPMPQVAWDAFELERLGKFMPQYPKVEKVGKTFRIFLNSQDRVAGSKTAATFNITLPHQLLADRLNIAVETFIHASGPNNNSAVEVNPTVVSLDQLRNPYSYSSVDGLTHGGLCITGSRVYSNTAPKTVAGATLVDRSFFDRPVTVTLSSRHYDVNGANGVTNDWSCVLVLWDGGIN
jgi:hypothetical protein